MKSRLYGAGEFLQVQEYAEPSDQLHERHDASDFETKTQDKIGDKTTNAG